MSEEARGDMTPLSYMKIFFRRKEFLIIPAIIGLTLGICAGLVLPPEYESSTIMLVEEGKTDNPLFDKLTVSTTVQQRMLAIKESMLGWNSLVELVRRLGMDRDVSTPKEFEDLILGIKDRVNIQLRGQNIINLSFTARDPKETQAVVKNITDIFIEKNVEIQNQETSSAITFIEEQLKLYRSKIKSAEIAQLREDLQTLLYDATENHPDVKRLMEQITQKQEELRRENLEYHEDILKDTNTNTAIIQGIQEALQTLEMTAKGGPAADPGVASGADPKSAIYKVMLMEKMDQVKARDAGINQSIYGMLLQRLETAKITQRLQSSKEGTRYTVLDPPRLPLEPVKPNKILLAILGLAGGVGIGIGLIFLFEFLDKSFLDVEEAKTFLGAPLLGAISKINTEAVMRQERERQAWLYTLTVVFAIVLVILTAAIMNFVS
jgi:uncharacterized protein involved in exopolysaccharide biosynthesis